MLQVYDVVSRTLRNTGQAVIPCTFEACDPREPYRVIGSKVKFLTFEPDQGGLDLSGEGSTTDVVLQVYDFCNDRNTVIGRVSNDPAQAPFAQPKASGVFRQPGRPLRSQRDLRSQQRPVRRRSLLRGRFLQHGHEHCNRHTSIACDDECRLPALHRTPAGQLSGR